MKTKRLTLDSPGHEGKGMVEPLCIGTVRGVVQGLKVGQEGVTGGGQGIRNWGRVR